MKRGYTLVEALVATAIACLVIGGAIGLFVATRRMSNAGDLSSAMADAAMAMETIHRDLIQAVQKPDPAIDRIVYISKTKEAWQFIRGEKTADGKLTGQVVVYRKQPTGVAGHFRILRRLGSAEGKLPGVYSEFSCYSFGADPARPVSGGPFLRVTLRAVARNADTGQPKQSSDEALLTSLVRVAGPEMIETPLRSVKAMEELKKVELVKNEFGF